MRDTTRLGDLAELEVTITFRTYSMNASNPGRTYHGDVDAFGIYCTRTAKRILRR